MKSENRLHTTFTAEHQQKPKLQTKYFEPCTLIMYQMKETVVKKQKRTRASCGTFIS